MMDGLIKHHYRYLNTLYEAAYTYSINALVNDWCDPGEYIEMYHSLELVEHIAQLVQYRGVPITRCEHTQSPNPNFVYWTETCSRTGQQIWSHEPVAECEQCGCIVELDWMCDDVTLELVRTSRPEVLAAYQSAEEHVDTLNRENAA